MSNQHSFKMIRNILAGAFVSLASAAALAGSSTVLLPTANEMSAGTYGDFTVFSLDLLQQCAAANDPRCLPSGPYAVKSGPGQISDNLLVYQATSTGENYDSPLSNGTKKDPVPATGDNAFVPPTGNTYTFEFSPTSEPNSLDNNSPSQPSGFTGDQKGTWEVQLGALAHYLGLDDPTKPDNNMIFIFDNNQQGAGINQWMYIWATASILDSAGILQGGECYALNKDGNCSTAPISPGHYDLAGNWILDNTANTNYIPIATDFCVDKASGVSYNIGTAANAGSCAIDTATNLPRTGYFVSNNLGQSSAEFAAYNMDLNEYIVDNWKLHPDWVLSINAKFANLTDGGETLWIASTAGENVVPEPNVLALLGLGLLAMVVPFRRRRRQS